MKDIMTPRKKIEWRYLSGTEKVVNETARQTCRGTSINNTGEWKIFAIPYLVDEVQALASGSYGDIHYAGHKREFIKR